MDSERYNRHSKLNLTYPTIQNAYFNFKRKEQLLFVKVSKNVTRYKSKKKKILLVN